MCELKKEVNEIIGEMFSDASAILEEWGMRSVPVGGCVDSS